MADFDVIIAGGGLAGSLLALRIAALRPELRLALIEAGPRLGGEHTWSFHGPDISDAAHGWLAPFVAHRWPRQAIAFPAHGRTLETPYLSISSDSLHDAAAPALGRALHLDEPVLALTAESVETRAGTLTAPCIVDARGPQPHPALTLGFQKFLGLEVITAEPHGVAHPVIMDATVPQHDGYRFVYLLPYTPTRLLIEDTYYSDGEALDETALESRIRAYARAKGWTIAEVVRSERGVLPVVLGGDIDAYWRGAAGQPARIGLRAALFHPTTGYSLPDAVRTAETIALMPRLTTATVAAEVERLSRAAWDARGIFRLLNRMLFRAAEPGRRYAVLERFYRLPQPLVERFYAARLTPADKLRILAGWPPVPLGRALGQLSETRSLARSMRGAA